MIMYYYIILWNLITYGVSLLAAVHEACEQCARTTDYNKKSDSDFL